MSKNNRRGPMPPEGRWLYDLLRCLDPDRRHEVILLVAELIQDQKIKAPEGWGRGMVRVPYAAV
jgi:hypothetical protein